MEIKWSEKKDGTGEIVYRGIDTEYIIHKETYFWVLTYADFWTLDDNSFFVNVKRHHNDTFAVIELMQYAEKVHVKYLEHKEKNKTKFNG